TYTSAFMYEGDSAERAAALAVDPALLAKLLGKSGEGLQLDPAVIERVVSAAQWLADGRQAGTAEQAIAIDRKSARLHSSPASLPTLSLHDALPIYLHQRVHVRRRLRGAGCRAGGGPRAAGQAAGQEWRGAAAGPRGDRAGGVGGAMAGRWPPGRHRRAGHRYDPRLGAPDPGAGRRAPGAGEPGCCAGGTSRARSAAHRRGDL